MKVAGLERGFFQWVIGLPERLARNAPNLRSPNELREIV